MWNEEIDHISEYEMINILDSHKKDGIIVSPKNAGPL